MSMVATAACGGSSGATVGADGEVEIDRLETVIVQAAGGGTDVLARAMIEKLIRPELPDATFATTNEEGDAGLLGLSSVERSDSGDAVIGFVNSTTAYAQYARGEDAAVDMREMTPIAGYGNLSSVVIVSPEYDVETFDDLVELYSDGDLPYGGTSPGGSSELTAHLLKSEYDVDWSEYIAYDGSGELVAAIARGEVPAGHVSDTTAADALAAGTAVPVLNFGSERSPEIPDVPTSDELDLPEIASGRNVRLILASSNIDDALRDRLVELFREALTGDEAEQWSKEADYNLVYLSPDEVSERLDSIFGQMDEVEGIEEILGGG